MKLKKLCAMGVVGLTSLVASSYGQGLVLNFAANSGGGAGIQFNGASDSFQFISNDSGTQWNITSETGGSSSVGLLGSFNNGPFSYGPITITGTGLAQVQSATVLGSPANL